MTITPEAIELGLKGQSVMLRALLASYTGYTPTPQQFELGLTDDNWLVRFAFASRPDVSPNPAQIERGLQDTHQRVRDAFFRRQAQWQAQELKKRHAQAIQPKTPTEQAL